MKKSLMFCALVLSYPCVSEASSLIVGGLSYHYDRSHYKNEVNPAIGFEHKGFSVIYISKNSIEQPSIQLSYGEPFYEKGWGSVGYRYGIATGYKSGQVFNSGKSSYDGFEIGGGVLPFAALELTINTPVRGLSVVMDSTLFVTMFGFKYTL